MCLEKIFIQNLKSVCEKNEVKPCDVTSCYASTVNATAGSGGLFIQKAWQPASNGKQQY